MKNLHNNISKNIITKTSALLSLTLGISFLSSCGSSSNSGEVNTLSVSIEPQRAMLEKIVGDKYHINTVIPAGANPETFEPSVAQRRQLSESQAWFVLGSLPMEMALARSGDKNKMIDVSEGIMMLEDTHEHTDNLGDHHEIDPHIWTSARNAKIMAQNMTDAIVAMDPENAQFYRENATALINQIDSLDQVLTEKLAPVKGSSFIVWHPSLGYFARDYGLEQLAIGQENKETSPQQIRHAIEDARSSGAKVFFYQQEFDTRQAESVNNEVGTQLVTIDPMSYEWMGQLEMIADYISDQTH